MNILIVGAGVFGVTAALELDRRGHDIRVLDPGPLPHPEASSTDISKIVRMDYGSEAHWTDLAEPCLSAWEKWNQQFGETLFHRSGLLCLTASPMAAGSFEGDSFELLTSRGQPLERVDPATLVDRFPAFSGGPYIDGYFNPNAGWARSARAVELLVERARRSGVTFVERGVEHLIERGERVVGAKDTDGGEHMADLVLVAAGAWTPLLLPHLEDRLACVGQPVVHFRIDDLALFQPPQLPVWTADIGTTGWYGFPAQNDGVLKVGHHGAGRCLRGTDTKQVWADEIERCREFLRHSLPIVAAAPIVAERLCLYCDSFDHAFLIDHDPDRPGLFVAAGGSGHGFKFAPLLGSLIADVVERRVNPHARRFAWRDPGETVMESCRGA